MRLISLEKARNHLKSTPNNSHPANSLKSQCSSKCSASWPLKTKCSWNLLRTHQTTKFRTWFLIQTTSSTSKGRKSQQDPSRVTQWMPKHSRYSINVSNQNLKMNMSASFQLLTKGSRRGKTRHSCYLTNLRRLMIASSRTTKRNIISFT
jgi:hypothetical protein